MIMLKLELMCAQYETICCTHVDVISISVGGFLDHPVSGRNNATKTMNRQTKVD